ncbi:MAG: hypothetical protein C5B59_20460 [Bacteroidetes bacterium]|nr:MAG: hypothetical protein C5B59_20460 [Bacteroidota bacterium]
MRAIIWVKNPNIAELFAPAFLPVSCYDRQKKGCKIQLFLNRNAMVAPNHLVVQRMSSRLVKKFSGNEGVLTL